MQEERDGLRAELDRLQERAAKEHRELVDLRAEARVSQGLTGDARTVALEAELTNLRRNAGNLVSIVRNIINTPTTTRVDVQAKLTLAMQAFEREMGESWTG